MLNIIKHLLVKLRNNGVSQANQSLYEKECLFQKMLNLVWHKARIIERKKKNY